MILSNWDPPYCVQLHVVSGPTTTLPFQVEDAARPEEYFHRVFTHIKRLCRTY